MRDVKLARMQLRISHRCSFASEHANYGVSRALRLQTVGDLRAFIAASRPDLGSSYRLATAFPAADLPDDSRTLQAAGLANAVVVQKKA